MKPGRLETTVIRKEFWSLMILCFVSTGRGVRSIDGNATDTLSSVLNEMRTDTLRMKGCWIFIGVLMLINPITAEERITMNFTLQSRAFDNDHAIPENTHAKETIFLHPSPGRASPREPAV